jgi:hypothetical protein
MLPPPSRSIAPSGLTMSVLVLVLALPIPRGADAQTRPPQQVVKPPVAQLWIDVATATMPGMPEMPAMPSLGALMGRGGGAEGNNIFGQTRGISPGRHVDIAFVTQRRPGGTEASQTVPTGTGLAPSLPLVPVRVEPRSPAAPGMPGEPGETEPPKGRILFYWGCGETIRPGQPRVLDFSKGPSLEWANFMQGRAPRERGAIARPGHSIWPNDKDRRSLGRDASLTGEHTVSGDGVPADLRFMLSAAHDFMAPIALQQAGALADVLRLTWPSVPNARAYFLNAMSGSEQGGTTEMVVWSSAEVPDFGMGLMDYASPANVDQWLREKVLLAPGATQCAIPQGIFARAEGAMLRMIAYGPELNLAHPPRPADVRIAWEPDWAVRVRTKSTAMTMLGANTVAGRGAANPMGASPGPVRGSAGGGTPTTATAPARSDCPPPSPSQSAGSEAARAGAEVGGAVLGGGWGRSIGSAVGGVLGALGAGAKKEEPRPAAAADCPR